MKELIKSLMEELKKDKNDVIFKEAVKLVKTCLTSKEAWNDDFYPIIRLTIQTYGNHVDQTTKKLEERLKMVKEMICYCGIGSKIPQCDNCDLMKSLLGKETK